ncbi:hypothetical protein LXL04_020027 [Taraxacum kok-saghyz]
MGSDLMSATEQDLDKVGIGSGELSPISELSSDMQQSQRGYIALTHIPIKNIYGYKEDERQKGHFKKTTMEIEFRYSLRGTIRYGNGKRNRDSRCCTYRISNMNRGVPGIDEAHQNTKVLFVFSKLKHLQSADHICKPLQQKRWTKRLQSELLNRQKSEQISTPLSRFGEESEVAIWRRIGARWSRSPVENRSRSPVENRSRSPVENRSRSQIRAGRRCCVEKKEVDRWKKVAKEEGRIGF